VATAGTEIADFCNGFQTKLLAKERPQYNATQKEAKRTRRQVMEQTAEPPKKNRGQTQTQFIAFGKDGREGGKAEASAGPDSSRAVVSKYTTSHLQFFISKV